ncbi:iron chelate uptake ABC transporter family permease subunit [Mycobacterium sp. 236(2023)]|uniref:FecCD family ABC transporter permease n=1 Tax=Mycobacterium sp. 236(2023) TaxID=3038163 RepID=UPI002414D918|nr:iron chelate uptake ABC transporter family permease subunit [Mycobacterium sp. 236(2023)]MDG4666982.1 iron chelate uptake ABC transporter family permease subunit [Mycobacterium sp. 236(2023)]
MTRTARLRTLLVALLAGLAVVAFFSVSVGSRDVTLMTVWYAIVDFDPQSTSQTVIRDMRVPRTLVGLLAGVALGLGGAILQGATRNPLADPGIMGINAGAAAVIVTAVLIFGPTPLSVSVVLAFLGAGATTALVYLVASFGREGATPVKLALAGAAASAGLYSVTTGVVMMNVDALNELRFWQVGSLAGRYWPVLIQTAPFLIIGALAALLCGRLLNGLSLGDDMAVALGQNVRRTRIGLFVAVAVLCGAATAACGPIVFVGLVIPHIARAICGPDYRWVLAFTAVLSPMVLLTADIVGRLIAPPGEVQVGVVLGVLGAPAFIALVRRRDLAEL